MATVSSKTPLFDACILLAPALPDEAALANGKQLAAIIGQELPVHILIPECGNLEAPNCWSGLPPSSKVHLLPAQAGSAQMRALTAYLHEHHIVRPWVILWHPSFVRLAAQVYAPGKAFVAGPWLAVDPSDCSAKQTMIVHHDLHAFITRQSDVVFLTDQTAEPFLRKDLGFYGRVLPRSSWEAAWMTERDSAASARASGTPHYSHKLDILVELETPALTDSAHAVFLNLWAQTSRHRIQFCRHVIEADDESAARSREDYDVLLRVCEPGAGLTAPLADWKSWQQAPGFKTLLLGDAVASVHHEEWALRHGVHQVISAATLSENDACTELDESFSRQVHGLQNWVLQQPKQLVHHGLGVAPTQGGAGGLDEVYEIQDMCARIWPLDFGDIQHVHQQLRDTIQQLDEELEQLGYRNKRQAKDKGSSILDSLRKRLTSLFRPTKVC